MRPSARLSHRGHAPARRGAMVITRFFQRISACGQRAPHCPQRRLARHCRRRAQASAGRRSGRPVEIGFRPASGRAVAPNVRGRSCPQIWHCAAQIRLFKRSRQAQIASSRPRLMRRDRGREIRPRRHQGECRTVRRSLELRPSSCAVGEICCPQDAVHRKERPPGNLRGAI